MGACRLPLAALGAILEGAYVRRTWGVVSLGGLVEPTVHKRGHHVTVVCVHVAAPKVARLHLHVVHAHVALMHLHLQGQRPFTQERSIRQEPSKESAVILLVTLQSHAAQAAVLACSGASPGCTLACRYSPVRPQSYYAPCL